jgi:hypothetical protein
VITEPVLDNPAPQPLVRGKSCTSCNRRRLHVSADVMRCSEQRSSAIGGAVWLEFKRTEKDDAWKSSYEQHARVLAAGCKYYQREPQS